MTGWAAALADNHREFWWKRQWSCRTQDALLLGREAWDRPGQTQVRWVYCKNAMQLVRRKHPELMLR